MKNRFYFITIIILIVIVFSLTMTGKSYANNLAITNVTLEDRTPAANTVIVELDLTWDNSWRSKINHDAIWLTVRLYDPTVSPTDKKLCQLTTAGLNPTGTNTGSNSALEVFVPSDKTGVFIRPADFSVNGSISSSDIRLSIDYGTCGFTENDDVYVSIFGLEMVLIPEGAFYAGDHTTSSASLNQGSADTDPWYISGESSISVDNPASDGYRYVSNSNVSEDLTGAAFTLPAAYPKGFGAFYVMKYELTEGQWIEFVGSLPISAGRANRDLTDSSHKNSDAVQFRNTLNCTGSPLSCSTQRPGRALSYLSWMDLAAFLDWAALRPMTELEFEKMARGPIVAVEGEFAWGAIDITSATTLSGTEEDGTETVTNISANAHYNNNSLLGGDSGLGVAYTQGPIRSGIFATSVPDRIVSGAGYYGVMEISGNLKERVVTLGNIAGRSFTGSHGNGYLSTASGYEGDATNIDWPGIDAITDRGVTGADGSGFRGGAWDDQLSGARLRISDRNDAALTSTVAANNYGGRGVRSYDGN